MVTLKRNLLMAVVIALVVSMLAGCGGGGAATPAGTDDDNANGGILTIAVVNDPPTFDLDRTTWVELSQACIYDMLVQKDMDGNLRPMLAESWEISDDGLEITMKLREDVKFHCGHPFTAEDMKFRIDRMQDEDNPSANLHMAINIDSVTVDDTYTITFHMKEVDAAIWDFLGTAFGAPFCPVCIEEYGEDYGQHPCGTGPWKLEEHVPGSHLTVTRNEEYAWGAEYWENRNAPHLEKLQFRFIADESTRLLELEKGSIDFVDGVPPAQVSRLEENEDIQIVKFPSNGIRYWGFNCKKWPWTEKAVRQAMQFAVDKEAIAESALEGLATALWSSLPPSIAGYSDELEAEFKADYPFDTEKAKETLEADGWTLGADGVYAKDGKSLVTSIWVVNDPVNVRVAEMLKADLAEAGVDLNIEIMEQATLTTDSPKGLHDTILWQYGWYDPDILYHVFRDGGTRMHYLNQELEDLLEAGKGYLNLEDRLPYYDEVQTLLADEGPWVVLYFPESLQGWSSRVTNIKNNPHNGEVLLNDIEIQ